MIPPGSCANSQGKGFVRSPESESRSPHPPPGRQAWARTCGGPHLIGAREGDFSTATESRMILKPAREIRKLEHPQGEGRTCLVMALPLAAIAIS